MEVLLAILFAALIYAKGWHDGRERQRRDTKRALGFWEGEGKDK
jgi:hypothetical protein